MATDTTVDLSRRGEALKVKKQLSPSALPIPHGTLGSQGALWSETGALYFSVASSTANRWWDFSPRISIHAPRLTVTLSNALDILYNPLDGEIGQSRIYTG